MDVAITQIVVDKEEFYLCQEVWLIVRTTQYYHDTYLLKTPCMNSSQTGHKWMMDVFGGHESHCFRMFRMNQDVFKRLCIDLHDNYGLRGSKNMLF